MSTYIHFTEEQKEQARQTDLVELLRGQGEKLKPSGHEFKWRDESAKVTRPLTKDTRQGVAVSYIPKALPA